METKARQGIEKAEKQRKMMEQQQGNQTQEANLDRSLANTQGTMKMQTKSEISRHYETDVGVIRESSKRKSLSAEGKEMKWKNIRENDFSTQKT